MNMKKTNTLKGVNSMPAGTRIVTYICLAWALIVSLLPIGWLVDTAMGKVINKMLFALRDSVNEKAFLECVAGLEKTYEK